MKTILAIIFFLIWSNAHAAITLPFSTTFDCAEQDQSSGGWVDCDGLSAAGAHTTSLGAESQITSAANYSLGGGGRGHRYWIGPGSNNNSGGIDFELAIPQTELYIRWYVRWESGLDLDDSQKVLYSIGGGSATEVYFDLGDNNDMVRVVSSGDVIAFADGFGWSDLNGGSDASDGAWHCFEVRIKNNAVAGTDVVTWWIDGVQRLNATNVSFNSNDAIVVFGVPSNQRAHNFSGDKFNDTDDFAVRTTGPIGCLSAAPAIVGCCD